MKKYIITAVFSLLLFNFTNAQFVRIWEKSDALNNLPSWFSPTETRERGIAFSIIDGIPKLYVISNQVEPTVIILNAYTGDSLGVLNTTGINGGLLALSDISSPYYWGPKLYACNLTENAAITPFKIYSWESDTSSPELIIVDSISTFRMGDYLNPGMFWHIITASSNNNKIVDYYSEIGNPPFIRREITLSDGNMGSNASADYNFVYPIFPENYIVNSEGFLPKFYDSTGVFQFISDPSMISANSNSIKFYANGTLCCDLPFYTSFQSDSNNAVLILGYPPWEDFWGETPSLGNNLNPQNYGDVEYGWLAMDTLYVFVLAGNNGIGAYYAPGLATPVELISFDARVFKNNVKLKWSTATELNNSGFEIERKESGDRSQETEWDKIGFIEGYGTTTEQHNYSFTDESVASGKYQYRLKQIDYDGTFEYSNIIDIEVGNPNKFTLEQNYPNPFNPSTKIKFTISDLQFTSLKVYDVLGNEVATIVNEVKPAGTYEVEFNPVSGINNPASGIYFYQLKSGSFIQTKKMILLK